MDIDIYKQEVFDQAQNVQMAWADLHAAVGAGNDARTWHSAQALLISAANLSKLFWPQGESGDDTKSAKAAALRSAFGVTSGHTLQDRTLRNHFEHFDERLDTWNKDNPTAPSVFVDKSVYPAGQPYARITEAGGKLVKALRELHPNWRISCLGDEIDLQKLVDEVAQFRTPEVSNSAIVSEREVQNSL